MESSLRKGIGFAGLGLVIACSSANDSASTSTSDATGGVSGVSSIGSTGGETLGSGGSGSVDDPQPLEPPEDWVGNIVVQRTRAFVADESAVYVDFAVEGREAYEAVVGPVTVTCTTDEYGGCKRTRCVTETPGPGTLVVSPDLLPPLVQLEAGTLQVSATGGASGAFSAVGDPDRETQLYDLTATGSLEGGEVLDVSAEGGLIEAFAATLEMPVAPLLLAPAAPAAATGVVPITVSQSDDLVIDWNARAAAGSVWLVPRPPERVDFAFSCRFDAAAGTGTVTREALAVLPSGTELHLFAENYTTVETAAGTILVEAVGEFVGADEASYPLLLVE